MHRKLVIDWDALDEFDSPVMYINELLKVNHFDMREDITRNDDFFNKRIIYTQEMKT
ncbi:MAG: hypothetical protein KJN62_10105 [Deltaproteobacteria bacterium]|nr:hypothetical protein [Deltaproteobacteria bacterium]